MENTVTDSRDKIAIDKEKVRSIDWFSEIANFFKEAKEEGGVWLLGKQYMLNFRKNYSDDPDLDPTLVDDSEYCVDIYRHGTGYAPSSLGPETKMVWAVPFREFYNIIPKFKDNSDIHFACHRNSEMLWRFEIKLDCGQFKFNHGKIILRSDTFSDAYFEHLKKFDGAIFWV